MKNFITTIFFIGIQLIFFAQADVKFTNSNFPGRAKEVSAAKKAIQQGNAYFEQGNFTSALTEYNKAQTLNPNNAELNFKIGICRYNSKQKASCLQYFEKAYKLNKVIDKKIYFYLGRAYHWNCRFAEAIKTYNDYLRVCKEPAEKKEVQRYLQEAENGLQLIKDTIDVKIINLGANINSEFSDYNAQVTSDGSKLYFTSRRKGTGNRLHSDGYPLEDIYESSFVNGAWTKAKSVGRPLNTDLNDAVAGLSPDGQTMYVYIDKNGGDIYVTKLVGSKWTTPKSISQNVNSDSGHEMQACLTADNKTFYFVSNGFDSKGKHDIFYSTAIGSGWSKPTNLGSTINTIYDERTIFLHPDGRTLYFSSEGHNTMGSYDIFKTVKDDNGNWSKPQNLGYPINTPLDDIFFTITASGKKAYMTSIRDDSYGLHDLYELRFPEKASNKESEKVLVTLVKGTVKDAETKMPLEATIEITDNAKNEVITTFKSNSASGEYIVNLASGKNYGLSIIKQGYLFHSENFNLADTADFREVVIDILLEKAEIGTTIILKNIFFDYNKSSLQASSHAELDRVVEILTKQNDLHVEIGGHTDSQGSLDYNTKLSNDRAKAVVDYLVAHNISPDRLTYKGYAFTQPIATNDNEEGRQQNRRVEFKIVGKK